MNFRKNRKTFKTIIFLFSLATVSELGFASKRYEETQLSQSPVVEQDQSKPLLEQPLVIQLQEPAKESLENKQSEQPKPIALQEQEKVEKIEMVEAPKSSPAPDNASAPVIEGSKLTSEKQSAPALSAPKPKETAATVVPAETNLIVEAKPVSETKPAVEAKSVVEAAPVVEAKPTIETKTKSVAKAAPVVADKSETAPANQANIDSNTNTKAATATKVAPVAKVVSPAASELKILDFVLASNIEAREPQQVVESYASGQEKAYVFARLAVEKQTKVTFVWLCEGKERHRFTTEVHAAKKWRTHASTKIRPGHWKVQLLSDNKIIAERAFVVE